MARGKFPVTGLTKSASQIAGAIRLIFSTLLSTKTIKINFSPDKKVETQKGVKYMLHYAQIMFSVL